MFGAPIQMDSDGEAYASKRELRLKRMLDTEGTVHLSAGPKKCFVLSLGSGDVSFKHQPGKVTLTCPRRIDRLTY